MLDLTNGEQAVTIFFAQLPLPDDAVDCEPWRRHGDDDWRRFFLTREWHVAGLWVSVAGEQDHHGNIRRWMQVGGEDVCTASDRRQLIATLLEAGQLFDSLTNERPTPTCSALQSSC